MINVQSSSIKTEFVRVFEYDYRGKTVAQMQSDGWDIFRGSTSQISFNSYGVYVNNSNEPLPMRKIATTEMINKIRNAKKIKLSMTVYPYGAGEVGTRLFEVANYDTRSGITGIYVGTSLRQTHIYGTQYNDNISSSGSRTMTCEIDFEAKTLKTSDTLGYSRTRTLSDTQISNIKNKSNGLYSNMSYSSGTMTGFQSVKLEIK